MSHSPIAFCVGVLALGTAAAQRPATAQKPVTVKDSPGNKATIIGTPLKARQTTRPAKTPVKASTKPRISKAKVPAPALELPVAPVSTSVAQAPVILDTQFAPDGRLLALIDAKKLVLWDLANRETGKPTPRKVVENAFGANVTMAFSPDSSTVVTYAPNWKMLNFWDVGSGRLKQSVPDILEATFLASGQVLTRETNATRLREMTTGGAQKTLVGWDGKEKPSAILSGREGRTLVRAGSKLGRRGTLPGALSRMNTPVRTVAGLQKGKAVLNWVGESPVLRTGDVLRRVGAVWVTNWQEVNAELLRHAPGEKLTLEVERGGEVLPVEVGLEAQEVHLPYVEVWDLRTEGAPRVYDNGPPIERTLDDKLTRDVESKIQVPFALSHDEATLALLNEAGVIQLLDVANGNIKCTLEAPLELTSALEFAADDSTLVASGAAPMSGAGLSLTAAHLRQENAGTLGGGQVSVVSLSPSTEAARAGLQVGDVVEAYRVVASAGGDDAMNGETPVFRIEDLLRAGFERAVGERFALRVRRGDTTQRVTLTLVPTTFSAPVARLWDVASGELKATLWAPEAGAYDFSDAPALTNNHYSLLPEANLVAHLDATHGRLHRWSFTTGMRESTIAPFPIVKGTRDSRVVGGDYGLVAAPDGRTLLVPGQEAGLWDAASGVAKADLGRVDRYAFAPDNSLLVYTVEATPKVYDLRGEPRPDSREAKASAPAPKTPGEAAGT